jgi:putative dehydrogenase
MTKTVGIVGLGIMGGAIALNLIDRGWTVFGFDLSADRCTDVAGAGGMIASSVRDLSLKAPLILVSLPTSAAAHAVAKEIASSGVSQRIVVEASTFSISDKMLFEEILSEGGHVALDCPLSGTGAQAKNRDLVVYASGSSEAIAQCVPLFADFAKQSADLGRYGNGSRMKFVANLLVAIHNVAAGEAMALAIKAGLDRDQVVALIGRGAGGSRMFQMRAPMMAKEKFEPATMRISTWQKDMQIIREFAEELRCPVPLFGTTEPIYKRAFDQGFGNLDTASVFKIMKEMSGLTETNPV